MSVYEKMRTLNVFLQKLGTEPVAFCEICEVLSGIIDCAVYVLSREGKLIGHSFVPSFKCDILSSVIDTENEVRFSKKQNMELLAIRESQQRIPKYEDECIFLPEEDCPLKGKSIAILPAYGGGNRMGTIILARLGEVFSEEDLILGEYGATVVALELIRSSNQGRQYN